MNEQAWNLILIFLAIVASFFIVRNIVNIIFNIIDAKKNNKEFKLLAAKSCKTHNWANHMNMKFCKDCGRVMGKDGFLSEAQRKATTTVVDARDKYEQEDKAFRAKLAAEYSLTKEQFEDMISKYAKFKVDFQVNLIKQLNQKK